MQKYLINLSEPTRPGRCFFINSDWGVRRLLYIWIPAFVISSCLKQPENYPPVIESITLLPSENHTPGSEIGVTAMVTDRDGDLLQFRWESDGGIVHHPDQPSTVWELPLNSKPFSYESITLTVTDGKGSVTRSKSIQVSEGLLVEGFTYFEGTTIPVPGVEVTIGKFSTLSDERGYYSIPYLNEGTIVVTAFKEQFELYESSFYIDDPKSTINLPMWSPSETMQIYGNVRTIDQVTFEGLKVSLLNPDGTESSLYDYTDLSGRFELEGIPLGIRYLMVSNRQPENLFLNDSMVYRVDLDGTVDAFNARVKIKRKVLSDQFLSGIEEWETEGTTSEGFYLLGLGQHMILREFISVPEDAEKAMFYLNSFVIGGCDLIGNVPSHRVWIINREEEYMGGISWGGDGNNYTAELEWFPSESPNFMDIYGRDIKLKLELFNENSCVSDPLWRIIQIEFSYYY